MSRMKRRKGGNKEEFSARASDFFSSGDVFLFI
jgi:hypothetical protein